MNMRRLIFTTFTILMFFACQEIPVTRKPAHHPKIKKPVAVTIVAPAIPDSVCIAAVGDIMLGTSYPGKNTLPPDSAKSSFINVADELHNADVVFGNLEGTLLDAGTPAHYKMHLLSKAYLFRMPQSYGNVLKGAGFNVLSLANNHIGDFGDNGRTSTMNVLDSLGINYGGQLAHPSSIFKIKGITYGFCAFAPNAQTLPIRDLKNAAEVIRALKQQCDIVIVSFHGGGEGVAFQHVPMVEESFSREKRGNVRAFAHTAIDAGADIILGNGPHVCRAMELYKKRLIAYSLGNFCTYKSVSVSGVCGIAPLLKAYLNKKGEFLSGRIISNKQTHGAGLETDTLNQAVAKIRALMNVDFPASGLAISDDGKISKLAD